MFRDHWSAWRSTQAGLLKHPFQKDLKVHRGLENNGEENKIKNKTNQTQHVTVTRMERDREQGKVEYENTEREADENAA